MKTLTVRQVRDALAAASPPSLPGGRAGAEAGALFHDALSYAVRPEMMRALGQSGSDPEARRGLLRERLYDAVIGPRLTRDQARLQTQAGGLLDLWAAVEQLCCWIGGWGPLADLAVFDTEEPLERVLHAPGWREPVTLVGRLDAVIRPPGGSRWCLVELKLGGTHPEADLAQAVLYQELLRSARADGPPPPPTDMALVRFEPNRREIVVSAEQLTEARARLLDLIGRLAEVTGPAPGGARTAEPPGPGPDSRSSVDGEALADTVVKVLAEFGVNVRRSGAVIAGPAFVRVPVEPGRGVRLQSICQRSRDLQVRLGLARPPFIGTSGTRVVLDLQRRDRQPVRFSDFVGSIPTGDPLRGSAQVPVGVDLDGKLKLADLARPEHTHLLVAGTVGSGKSAWLNAAIAGLVHANRPETLRMVLIDPKRVGFRPWRELPFLLEPISHDDDPPAAAVLERLADLMDERYRAMEEVGAEDWREYVHRTGQTAPRIVCVCDEYADLIARGRAERQAVERQIIRLGSKARAAGIHLIVATQQPSREVIKGALDAVIPARVGLQMARDIESRMLLGVAGAERLLGHGDLLFKDQGEPLRLQGLWLDGESASAEPAASVQPAPIMNGL